jgi:hypothetical protein
MKYVKLLEASSQFTVTDTWEKIYKKSLKEMFMKILAEISKEKEILVTTDVHINDSSQFVQGEILYGDKEFILVFIPTRAIFRGFERIVIFSKVPSKLSSLELTSEVLFAGTGIGNEIVGDNLVWNSNDLPVSLLAVLKLWKGKNIVTKTGIA